MSKRKPSPVVMDKNELLLPKMEFVVLNSTTGAGLFVKELGGKALLEFRERVKAIEGDPSELQSIQLMSDLVLKTTCNEDGSPYFTEVEVEQLTNTSLVKLQALAEFAMEVSGIKGATNNLPNEVNSSSTDG